MPIGKPLRWVYQEASEAENGLWHGLDWHSGSKFRPPLLHLEFQLSLSMPSPSSMSCLVSEDTLTSFLETLPLPSSL